MPVVWNGVCFLSPKWAILIRHFVKNSHITDALIFCPCQNETLELVQISVGTLFCHLFFFLYKFVPDITYYNVTHPRRVCCWDGENCRSEKCRFRLNPTFSFRVRRDRDLWWDDPSRPSYVIRQADSFQIINSIKKVQSERSLSVSAPGMKGWYAALFSIMSYMPSVNVSVSYHLSINCYSKYVKPQNKTYNNHNTVSVTQPESKIISVSIPVTRELLCSQCTLDNTQQIQLWIHFF